jgi:ankyrin repeat protein
LTLCHLNIYSRNTPTLFLGYTNIYLLQNYIDLLFVIHNRYDAAVKLLVMQNDIDVNLTDQNGLLPLSYAAKNGHESIVRLLVVQNDINVDLTD